MNYYIFNVMTLYQWCIAGDLVCDIRSDNVHFGELANRVDSRRYLHCPNQIGWRFTRCPARELLLAITYDRI
jgi:hypothetical protein